MLKGQEDNMKKKKKKKKKKEKENGKGEEKKMNKYNLPSKWLALP